MKEASAVRRWGTVALRLALAAVFLLAGFPKLLDPATFTEQIGNYNLLPDWAPVFAVTLPATEIAAALALIVTPRRWRQAAVVVLVALLCGFTVALAQAWARGINVDCGCFGRGSTTIGPWTLARNITLLAAAGTVFWLELPRRRKN
jgi:putative oxidoreductase